MHTFSDCSIGTVSSRHLVASLILGLLIVGRSNGHSTWIIPPEPGSKEFGVLFAEGPAPEDPQYLKKIADVQVTLVDKNGNRQVVSLATGEDRLIGKIPDGFEVAWIDLQHTWGMFDRGDSKFLLKYRAIAYLDPTAEHAATIGELEKICPRITVAKRDEGYELLATLQGSPMPGVTIKSVGVGLTREWETNDAGKLAWNPKEAGLHGLVVKHTSNEVGKWENEAYETARLITSVTVRAGSSLATEAKNSSVDHRGRPRPGSQGRCGTSTGRSSLDNHQLWSSALGRLRVCLWGTHRRGASLFDRGAVQQTTRLGS